MGANHPASGALSPVNESTWGSATWATGAAFVGAEGSNLRVGVYSANATRMLLEVYGAATGQEAIADYWMVKGSDNVWRAELASVPGKTLYAFRAWGPNWPWNAAWSRGNSAAGFVSDVDAAGNRFNPNKVLFDPYARELSHDKETPALLAAGENGGMFGTGGTDVAAGQTYSGPITGNVAINRRNVDTAKWAPKSVALKDTTSFGTKPGIADKDSIVYEAHVRGLTQHPSSMSLTTLLSGVSGFETVVNVPDAWRGTYKGAGVMAPYLKSLGVNVIELLPIHETANDTNSSTSAGGNFWGYMTYGYFAPDRRYAADKTLGGPTREFKEMVKAFHDAGLEVWLDVVYNHTGEGGTWDATKKAAELTSFRGLDNQTYYALVSSDRASYWETTGCGNNVNTGHPVVSKLIKDSLVYFITQMGVDGFRFDLAPVLGRDASPNYAFNPNAALLTDIAALTTTYNVEMVAEAWDLGTYQVGSFPSWWGEWNGRYRDTTRRFLKGDLSGAGITYADAFNGDYTFFNDQGGASKSVNFVVAHDGFTLADLVSYGAKLNASLAWPFGPSDGGNDNNDSWDSGGNQALRRQRFRNFMVWQVFSRGVPMLVYGDEFARTQNGNNNPYNLDSVATWNNYAMISSDSPHTVATGASGAAYHNNFGTDSAADGKNAAFLFTKFVLGLRKGSTALRQSGYAMPINFARADGSPGFNSSFDRAVRIHLDGSAVGSEDWLLFVNMWTGAVDFTAPAADSGKRWVRVVDTAAWAETNNNVWDPASAWTLSGTYGTHPWSIVVFKSVN
ncbi:MAG: alpha-amylase family glycosyl hydrolase [Myxococcota bacterium]